MDLNDYQSKTATTAIYPKGAQNVDAGLIYTAMGLAGEAGEILNKVKKVLRGDYDLNDALRADLSAELGDVLWYVSQLAGELGVNLGDVAIDNLAKLADRKARGTLRGAGDAR